MEEETIRVLCHHNTSASPSARGPPGGKAQKHPEAEKQNYGRSSMVGRTLIGLRPRTQGPPYVKSCDRGFLISGGDPVVFHRWYGGLTTPPQIAEETAIDFWWKIHRSPDTRL